MTMKTTVIRFLLFALLMGAVATVPALAGSAVIGSVAGSRNASVGGQSLLPNTTIFSGDSLQVRDGVAVIAIGNNSRVVFGRDTVASFLRDSNNEVTVLLSQGDVSMLHPTNGTPVRVKAGEISITPVAGFKTLGEVAMLNGSVVVTAKEGSLQVDARGATKNVAKGQTIVISARTADQKKGAGNAAWGNNGSTYFDIAILAAAGTGAVLAGVAMSRAGTANDNAILAGIQANNATSAANSAISAANAATSAADAATSTAAAAEAAATYAGFLASCAADWAKYENYASAQQLSGGSQCPTYSPGTPTP